MAGKLQKEIQKAQPFASVEQEVFLNVQRTADALQRQFEAFLKQAELSATQYNVLRILRGAGEKGCACSEVANHMVTRDPDVTRLMDRLEKRSLIARARGVQDRRVVVAKITASGRKLLKQLDEPVLEMHLRQLSHMKPERLRALSELLEEARGCGGE